MHNSPLLLFISILVYTLVFWGVIKLLHFNFIDVLTKGIKLEFSTAVGRLCFLGFLVIFIFSLAHNCISFVEKLIVFNYTGKFETGESFIKPVYLLFFALSYFLLNLLILNIFYFKKPNK